MRVTPRLVAVALLIVAVAAIAVVLLGSGGRTYSVDAIFPDAGQIVRGANVEVAGRTVGSVKAIQLTADGSARLKMRVKSDELPALHEGTRAAIRAVGLASVTNRYVELTPGPGSARSLGDHPVLGPADTRGIVDLDEFLDGLTPTVRRQLQDILSSSAGALRTPTAQQINRSIRLLNPALAQTSRLGSQLTLDQGALRRLLVGTSRTAHALAARPQALTGAIASTSRAVRQVADDRHALSGVLERTPGFAAETRRTLHGVDASLPSVDRILRSLRPASPRFAQLLRTLDPVLVDGRPAFTQVSALLSQAKTALHPLPAGAKTALPALRTGRAALDDLAPVLEATRLYTPDLIAGLFGGLLGSGSGYYDANGHYVRIAFQFGAGSFPGLVGSTSQLNQTNTKTGQTARCPGGATDPADDKSNPLTDLPDGLCDPAENLGG